MSRRNATGRHRSAARPKTPLSELATAVQTNAGAMGRRSAVLAASSGLAMTIAMPTASANTAAPTEAVQSNIVLDPVAAPTDQSVANEAVAAAPAPEATAIVEVPEDAEIDLAAATVVQVVAPPEPVVPAAVVRATEQVNRGADRAAAPAAGSNTTAPAAPAEQAPAPAPETGATGSRAQVLAIAARYIGVPYRWGGTTPSGFDCSGYTQYVYRQVGVNLPRTSGAQAASGRRVSAAEARPGDLVWKPGHVGIYAGGNMMYDAPRTGKNIGKRKIWFKPTYIRVMD